MPNVINCVTVAMINVWVAAPTCTIVERKNSTISLAVNPGVINTQLTGTKAMMTVGMANTSEKTKVSFHLRMDLRWLTPESLESAEVTRAVKPAPCKQQETALTPHFVSLPLSLSLFPSLPHSLSLHPSLHCTSMILMTSLGPRIVGSNST